MNTASTQSDAISLHHVTFDDTVRPVVGELAALRLDEPSDRDYAESIRNSPSLVAIASRCTQRTQELERFITLAEASARYLVKEHIATPQAIAILNEEATLALALLPARTAADRHAQREHGWALIRAVQELDDTTLVPLARTAFGIEPLTSRAAGAVATNALAYAVANHREMITAANVPAVGRLEDAASLRAYVSADTDLEALYRDVEAHAGAAERLATMLHEHDLGHREHDDIAMALDGATLQVRIALLRIGMAAGLTDVERWARAIDDNVPHPTVRFAATLRLARKSGESLRDMLAAHPMA